MTFAIKHLSITGYANNYTAWHYNGRNSRSHVEDVTDGAFFQAAADMLTPGDTIMCSCLDGCRLLYVVGTEGGVVISVLAATP